MLSQADQEPSPTMIESAPATESAAAPSLATQAVSGDVLRIALVGALLGGLLLNLMPCVFPILSLKALSLAKSGGDPRAARMEGAGDRKSTRLNSSHYCAYRMPSSA